MKNKAGSSYIWNRPGSIDWKLLVFLLLFLNVKLVVKIAAFFLIYILRPDFKFGFRLKNSRLPLFYLLVIGIAVFNWLISGMISNFNYGLVLVTGIFFWVLCILAIHQVKLAVEKNDPVIIHRTIIVFFIINALVSLSVYAGIIWETGVINPYRYQGNYQKYFIGTGDYIKGITFDTSTTNAVLNAFGVIYFLVKEKYAGALFFMAVLLLTGSNITNILLCLVLIYLFILQSNKAQKSIIIVCFAFLAVFLAKVSPENNNYIITAYDRFSGRNRPEAITTIKEIPLTEKPDSILNEEERKRKIAITYIDSVYVADNNKNNPALAEQPVSAVNYIREKPVIPQPNIHTPPFQHRDDTTTFEKGLLTFIKKDTVDLSATKEAGMPGKAIALMQTFAFLKEFPIKLLTGNGMGNFSSKLAFKTTGLKIAGGYPEKYKYINPAFEKNNLALYLGYFTKTDRQHSLINTPNSVYVQLLGEYGLAGLAALFFFYIWFFAKYSKQLTYGIPVILFTCSLFFMEYWFEQLSAVIFFELLLFLNIKETSV